MVIIVIIIVFVFYTITRLPSHLVFLLESPSCVREPRRHLSQCHLGNNGEHDFLALGRIRILLVFVEPRLQRARCLPSCVLAPRSIQIHTVSVTTIPP